MTAPSDTPMTDDAWWRGDCEDEQLINIDHARTLERELDAAIARAEKAKADHAWAVDVSSSWEDRCLKAEAERDEARAELARLTTLPLWLWKNFVDGRPEYWAFDNPFPVHMDGGDPQTLGEPCGYAILKPSRRGRTDITDEQVMQQIIPTPKEPT